MMHKRHTEINVDKKNAAAIIQKYARTYLTHNRFVFHQLSIQEQQDCHAYMIGNDPVIEDLDRMRKHSEQFALIATSGFRPLLLASQLAHPQYKHLIPKIILIDNSRQVKIIWYEMKTIANTSAQQNDFLQLLQQLINTHKNSLYMDITDEELKLSASKYNQLVKYEKQNIYEYFENLFKTYGYDYIRSMIINASFISQTWEDKLTFCKIKNILELINIKNIYIYASNIIHYMPETTRMNVLSNIALLQPLFTIHTDTSDLTGIPEKVYILENNAPAEAYQILDYKKNNI